MYDRFSGIKFWYSERNTENTMLHYILMKKVIIIRKIHVKWSLSLHYRKKVKIFTPQLLIYYIQYENRKSRLEQMPEAATWGVLRKKVFFKMSHNSQETPVPEETPVNFAKFLRTPLFKNSGWLLLKCAHFNNEARDIDCISCRDLDALLYCFG